MYGPEIPDVHHSLHEVLERLTRERGASDAAWLAARARTELRDARIDEDAVEESISTSTMLL